MCFMEVQIPNCLFCGAVGVPDIWVLGCPFGLTREDCNMTFQTVVNVTRDHPTCVSLDQLCREVRLGIAPSEAVDDALGSPSYTVPVQTPTTERSLPAGWTATAVNTDIPSEALVLATQHRDDIVRMMEDLVPTIQSLNATVAPLDARLRVVIEWCEGYMAGMIVLANTYIANIQCAEFEIANNTAWSDQAQMDIAIIVDGIINQLSPFEGAFIWHRRLTDLFVHLRRIAGELSPPRPAGDEVTPIRRRRGAVTGLDDLADDHSDFLPAPEFYLPEDAFPDDGEPMEPAWDEFDS
ncbi:hypothetical protein KCU81_g7198, partial [Aureobasidium melanogenum]|uniref:Uncharacterized protein n=1 Tax=Aureobasidium melanogenum (strain CBS 110374) TaxID=1043003 RepID=A0A074VE70_AURM1